MPYLLDVLDRFENSQNNTIAFFSTLWLRFPTSVSTGWVRVTSRALFLSLFLRWSYWWRTCPTTLAVLATNASAATLSSHSQPGLARSARVFSRSARTSAGTPWFGSARGEEFDCGYETVSIRSVKRTWSIHHLYWPGLKSFKPLTLNIFGVYNFTQWK